MKSSVSMFCGLALDRDTSLVYLLAPSGFCRPFPFIQEKHLGATMGHGHLLDQDLGFHQLLWNPCSFRYQCCDLGQVPAFSFPTPADTIS